MKFLATLVALVATTLVAADFKEDCRFYHPKAYENINIFCAISNMVVPSGYARTGRYGQSGSHVWIDPTPANSCSPPQWVPSAVCYKQFYQICATHQKTRFYGKNLCQMWRIKYGAGATKAVQSDKWPFGWKTVPIKKGKRSGDDHDVHDDNDDYDDNDDEFGMVKEDDGEAVGVEDAAPVAA